jgi:hypothetical protein
LYESYQAVAGYHLAGAGKLTVNWTSFPLSLEKEGIELNDIAAKSVVNYYTGG